MRVQAIAMGAFGAVRLFRLPFVKALLRLRRDVSYPCGLPYAAPDEAVWRNALPHLLRQYAFVGTTAVLTQPRCAGMVTMSQTIYITYKYNNVDGRSAVKPVCL